MCRFLAYKGPSIILDELLYQPEHSLIKQSYNAKEMEEPLNGDGFGVGWYVPELGTNPGVFASIQPAWNNRNLRYLSPKIRSGCLFAHVRAASVGDVAEHNCHPFHYNNFLMMHNGGIDNFEEIKRPIIDKLSEERFRWIQGQTDSEHIFALFLDHLLLENKIPEPQDYADAFCKTFEDLENLKHRHGLTDASYLNLMITDGHLIIGSRYVTDSAADPLSLYHSKGAPYECIDGACVMNPDSEQLEKAVLLVSEKLNNNENDWHDVPANHFIIVNGESETDFIPV